MDTVHAPTDKELKKGPVVTLKRFGWNDTVISPHGFAYPIRFVDGKATVLKAHADAWLTDGLLATAGIIVEEPPAPKTPAPKKEGN